MGRLNVPKAVMDPNTVCNCQELGLQLKYSNLDPNLMHIIWNDRGLGHVGERIMHNVYAEVTISDAFMREWIARGVADITCTHRKSGSYDGIEMPQYCRDPITTLTITADNGSWVYKRNGPGNFGKGETYWRWPD